VGDTIRVADTLSFPAQDSLEGFVRVNRIHIQGNLRTRESIILRELRLKPGDSVGTSELEFLLMREQQKLFNLHLFNTATVTAVKVGPGLIDLNVVVDERWYTFPVLRFRLSDRNFNEWWQNYNHDLSRVVYGLKLYQYNLWGRNHTMFVMAEFGFQKNFRFMYKVPYINRKQTQGLTLEVDYSEGKNIADSTIGHKLNYVKSNDVLRTTRGVGLTYTFRNNFYVQHRLRYEYRYSSIADTIVTLNENYLGHGINRQRVDVLAYELAADRRDVAAYPLKGYEFLFGIRQDGILLHSDLRKTSLYARLAGYVPLGKGFYFSDLGVAYWSSPDNVPYYNYTTMGYDRTFIRGYEVYVVEGPYFVLNKATLKMKVFSQNWHLNNWKMRQFNYLPIAVYLKTYADVGYVENYKAYEEAQINTKLADKIISGVGFGMDIVTGYDLAVRLEYSFTGQGNGFFLHFRKEF
jgi:outer membrane protein assembly factor BamA